MFTNPEGKEVMSIFCNLLRRYWQSTVRMPDHNFFNYVLYHSFWTKW